MKGPKPESARSLRRGPLAWMVHNRVTPNIIMLTLLIGGAFMAWRIKKEVFPEFTEDRVRISMSYPGASPAEVEQGIVLAIEEAVRGVEGVKEVLSTADEGRATVNVELLPGSPREKLYQDIQQEVDRIITFPEDAEEPQVSLSSRRRVVLNLQVYGPVDEWALRELAEQVRDRLLQDPGITQVELEGTRRFEVRIEVAVRGRWLTVVELAADARVALVTALTTQGQLALSLQQVEVTKVTVAHSPLFPDSGIEDIAPAAAQVGVSLLMAQPLAFELPLQELLSQALALPLSIDAVGLQVGGAENDWLVLGARMDPLSTGGAP